MKAKKYIRVYMYVCLHAGLGLHKEIKGTEAEK